MKDFNWLIFCFIITISLCYITIYENFSNIKL